MLAKNLKINWDLENDKVLQDVVVKAAKAGDNISKTSIGTEKLDFNEIAKLPIIL